MGHRVKKPPKIEIKAHDPLQDYFYDGTGASFSVAKLIDDSKHLPVFDCPLACLELSGEIWKGCSIIALAGHCKRVIDADIDEPILLDWEGGIADGRHRVIRAIVLGKRTIKARRMTWRPTPCRTGV